MKPFAFSLALWCSILVLGAVAAGAVFADPPAPNCDGPAALVQTLKAQRDATNDQLASTSATLLLMQQRLQADEAEIAKLKAPPAAKK